MPDLIERTIAVLRINGERWQALATGIDRELLARRPEPGEWSALECLGHTTDTEELVFTRRVKGFLTGVSVLQNYDPDTMGTPDHGCDRSRRACEAARAATRSEHRVARDPHRVRP